MNLRINTAFTQVQVVKPQYLKRTYEFLNDGRKVAELVYPKAYGRLIQASVGERKWQIRKAGFWKQYIELTAEQSPSSIARIELGWNYKLRWTMDGKTFHLKQTSMWKNVWTWFDDNRKPVIEMKSNMCSLKNRGSVLLHQPEKMETALLMLLGWVVALSHEDAAMLAAG